MLVIPTKLQIKGGGLNYWYVDTKGAIIILTFPSSNGFGCFEPGDVVQDPDVKVVSKTDVSNTTSLGKSPLTGNLRQPVTS